MGRQKDDGVPVRSGRVAKRGGMVLPAAISGGAVIVVVFAIIGVRSLLHHSAVATTQADEAPTSKAAQISPTPIPTHQRSQPTQLSIPTPPSKRTEPTFPASPKIGDAAAALKLLEGEWKVEEMVISGEVTVPEILWVTFDGDRMTSNLDPSSVAKVKLDPSTNPASLSITDRKGTSVGIYELNGTVLRLCVPSTKSNGRRPMRFKSTEDDVGIHLWTLKRVPQGATEKALRLLQGEWEMVKRIEFGIETVQKKKFTFTIRGSQIVPSDDPLDVGTLKIDPTTSPQSINIISKSGTHSFGIYETAGDALNICFGANDEARPKELKSTKDNGLSIWFLRRAKSDFELRGKFGRD